MKSVRSKRIVNGIIAGVFWIGLWQVISIIYGMDFVLPSPGATFRALLENMTEGDFWLAVLQSTVKIMSGFLLASVLGFVLSVLGIKFKAVRVLFDPFCSVIRAVPVASFIILVLVMFSSRNVSLIISFLMAFPVVYSTLSKGMDSADPKLLEAAKIFRMSFVRRLKFIYMPGLMPYMASALSVSCGLAFKSGIAAEVIGFPKGSVGEAMYLAKVSFDMTEMLSYTAVIVVISVIVEKTVVLLCRKSRGGTV